MNDLEAIQRKLTELDVKIDLLTKRTLAYVTTILQILHNREIVGFREDTQASCSRTPCVS